MLVILYTCTCNILPRRRSTFYYFTLEVSTWTCRWGADTRGISLPSKSSHIVTWIVSVSPRSHSALQSLLHFHIHHPSGRRGDNTIRLVQAGHVPTPRVAPGAESVMDRYIHTLAQIRPLHCKISCLALRHSATRLIEWYHAHAREYAACASAKIWDVCTKYND